MCDCQYHNKSFQVLNKIKQKFWLQYLLFKTIKINKLQISSGNTTCFDRHEKISKSVKNNLLKKIK